MKRVKTVLMTIALAGLTLGGISVQAGDQADARYGMDKRHGGEKHGGGRRMEKMAERLDLSDEQRAEMEKIHQSAGESMAPLHEKMKAGMKAEREALENGASEVELEKLAAETAKARVALMIHRRDVKQQVTAVLTEEQKAKLAEMKAERRAKMEERREKWQEKRWGDKPE